jgi:hypothetical protein
MATQDYIDTSGVQQPTEFGQSMTREETVQFVRKSGYRPAVVDEAWAIVDQDGDGEIDNSEFPTLLERMGRSAISGIGDRVDIAPLWVYALLVEHAVFLTRVLILVFFPTTPGTSACMHAFIHSFIHAFTHSPQS